MAAEIRVRERKRPSVKEITREGIDDSRLPQEGPQWPIPESAPKVWPNGSGVLSEEVWGPRLKGQSDERRKGFLGRCWRGVKGYHVLAWRGERLGYRDLGVKAGHGEALAALYRAVPKRTPIAKPAPKADGKVPAVRKRKR